MTPTSRTLALLRSTGWNAQVVERWNAFAKIRVDLFGVIDIIACNGQNILGVQATSYSNKHARIAKIRDNELSSAWLKSGGLLWVVSWRKKKKKRGGKAFCYVPDVHIVESA